MVENKIILLVIVIILLDYISPLKSDSKPSLKEVMSYISSQILPDIRTRKIKVYTEKDWDYLLTPSVSKYLFEDIKIIENLAQKGQINRPGNIYEKRYICVHDTGDHSFGAKQWSDVVKNAKIGETNYTSSF